MIRILAKDGAAEEDLIDIWLYSLEMWGETQADRYLASLESGIHKILRDPNVGRPRDALRPGYRSLRVEHHVVFYTFTDAEVRIRRVLHEVMEADRHL